MTIHKAVVIFMILLSSCRKDQPNQMISQDEAIAIADVYIAKNYPMAPRDILQPVVHDQDETWLVTYSPPPDSAGGTPTIEIDKRTSRIVYASHGQ